MKSLHKSEDVRCKPIVTVRGIGVFTPAGSGYQGVGTREHASKLESTPTETEWVRVVKCDVESALDLLPNTKIRRLLSRAVQLGIAAAVQALDDAGTSEFPCEGQRLGVFASGFTNLEEFAHLHELLRYMQQKGLDWRGSFGEVATRRLPPFMLLRRLPNAAFCHVAQLAGARGYNATILTGPVSGLDCLRQAAKAIQNERIDAALVVSYDSPLTWELTSSLARLIEASGQSNTIVLGEGGIALYLEREDLHPERKTRPYAKFMAGAATQAREGLVCFDQEPSLPKNCLSEAVERAVATVVAGYDPTLIEYLDVSDMGLEWLDEAERSSCRIAQQSTISSSTEQTGYLGNASGGLGIARICYLLSAKRDKASGLVVRASPTGQCGAILLQTVENGGYCADQ